MPGTLIAFEGLDQSGKQTQAERLHAALTAAGRQCQLLSFPDYTTPIGAEIRRALQDEREYSAEVMQLLYVANRYELKPQIDCWLAEDRVILCDRYAASSVAYGGAHGLDAHWLADIQRFLPAADLTLLLDIPPEVAVARKSAGRDRYERDLDLLRRVRERYHEQAAAPRWVRLAADRPRDEVTAAVQQAVAAALALP